MISTNTFEVGDSFSISDIFIFDLTQMFGVTSTDAVTDSMKAWCESYASLHPEYNAGEIVSADVDVVSVHGRNLFDMDTELLAAGFVKNADGVYDGTNSNFYKYFNKGVNLESFEPSSQYSFIITAKCDGNQGTDGNSIYFIVKYSDSSTSILANILNKESEFITSVGTSSKDKTISSIIGSYGSFGNNNIHIKEIAITKGTLTDYSPYTHTDLPVPSAIRALPGYGWSAGSVYNEVDYAEKKYIQRVAAVDLGSLSWTLSTANGFNRFINSGIKSDVAQGIGTAVQNLLSECAVADTWLNVYSAWSGGTVRTTDRTMAITVGGGAAGNINIVHNSYTDAATFKTAMSGVMLYYELATPIETDISDLLADADIINPAEVEAGGSVTIHNGNLLATPNTEEYLISLAEVG